MFLFDVPRLCSLSTNHESEENLVEYIRGTSSTPELNMVACFQYFRQSSLFGAKTCPSSGVVKGREISLEKKRFGIRTSVIFQ